VKVGERSSELGDETGVEELELGIINTIIGQFNSSYQNRWARLD